jgi:DNA-binding transcriptional ArsR family regulator
MEQHKYATWNGCSKKWNNQSCNFVLVIFPELTRYKPCLRCESIRSYQKRLYGWSQSQDMHPDDLSHPDDGSDEKVLILPLGEESKKITQTLSNDSARQVLELLADKPMSASDIAEELDIPLTTVKYNLDALIESGLITIKHTRWSVKGREIKIYAPIQKLIVVVPNKADKKSVVDILKGYLGVLLGAAGISAIIEWWHKPLSVGTQEALRDVAEETASGIPMSTPVEIPPPMKGALPAPVCAPTPVNVTEAGAGGGATDVLSRDAHQPVHLCRMSCCQSLNQRLWHRRSRRVWVWVCHRSTCRRCSGHIRACGSFLGVYSWWCFLC